MPALTVEVTGKEAAERKLMRVKNYRRWLGGRKIQMGGTWGQPGRPRTAERKGKGEEKARMMLVKVKQF